MNRTCIVSQGVSYKIPGKYCYYTTLVLVEPVIFSECVEEVCECGTANSPYEFREFVIVRDHIYTIRFNKTDRNTKLSLEAVFDKVWLYV